MNAPSRRLASRLGTLCIGALVAACARAPVAPSRVPPPATTASWTDPKLSADERAKLLTESLTLDEKLTLLTGYFGVQTDWNEFQFPEARPQSAGLVRGVARLGFPPQWQTDAGSGVATQGEAPPALERTLLPSGILTASTWNPALAERGGAMIGSEARSSGFNVMLAGGVNLLRDPGNGRNFEYGGEDPLLAGTMVGALVRGIQSNRIVSTVKHFAFNDQETGRRHVDVQVDEAAARMSDLLAFQLAIEQGKPGSVMCSYNLVNGVYACQNEWLLSQVLKRDWGFRGYVMTDWGAQNDTVKDALAGLDQETGVRSKDNNGYQWLDKLGRAVEQGQVPRARVDDMVCRIARTLLEVGVIDAPVEPGPIDFAAHAQVTRAAAEEGIVLLKNERTLPLAATTKRVAVIGGHADVGVMTGGGSAQVYAPGGNAVRGLQPSNWPGPPVYARSSPLTALKQELPGAEVTYNDGNDRNAAAKAAAAAEVAIVFVTQWTAEALDFSLSLPDGQDELVEAVARANPRTVVVLETGGPVLMPWLPRVAAAVQAWYPGSEGGVAIARVLSGAVNPSGRLPASFPKALEQLPRPKIAGADLPKDQPFSVRFSEGAAVGYRWYDAKKLEPLFPFGHGLSYTTFTETDLTARLVDQELEVSFSVRNAGTRAGKHVSQVYVSPRAGGWEASRRLGAFTKLDLAASATATATLRIEPRLLALFDVSKNAWHVAAGDYQVILASSAKDEGKSVSVRLPERWLPAGAGVAASRTAPTETR